MCIRYSPFGPGTRCEQAKPTSADFPGKPHEMTQDDRQKRSKIPLKAFLTDYKSSMVDAELMEKYGLTVANFISLMKTLTQKGLLTSADRELRKRLIEAKELAKETTFLRSLFLCANCGHPHPKKFDICPACGADQSEFAEGEDETDHISTTGGHFYVPEPRAPEPKVSKEKEAEASPPRSTQPAAPGVKKPPAPSPDEKTQEQPPKKRSAIESIRSLFSRDKGGKSDKK
jgi:hypothetical protein